MPSLETLPSPVAEQQGPPSPEELHTAPELAPLPPSTPERQEKLDWLLGADREYAEQAGLVDMFDYDPATNQDGLVHMLAGDVSKHPGGAEIPGGFHHEPSAGLWDVIKTSDGEPMQLPSSVDTTHLDNAPSKQRQPYRRRLAEPYLARVAVAGQPKMEVTTDAEGNPRLAHTRNAMFPQEYDGLAVMQAVRQAKESSAAAPGTLSEDDQGQPVLVKDGQATMIDGVTQMPIRLILNADTQRVRAAYPLTQGRAALMGKGGLTEEQMMAHATMQTPTSAVRF